MEQPELRLLQSAAPPAERDMRLSAAEAYVAARSGYDEYLIAMPAPHAVAHTRDFLLFLSVPSGATWAHIEPGAPGCARGYLLQTVGLRAGRSKLVAGVISRSESWLRPGRRRVEINVEAADGTRIVGVAFPTTSEPELNAFARRYAADIADLAPTSQPASAPPE